MQLQTLVHSSTSEHAQQGIRLCTASDSEHDPIVKHACNTLQVMSCMIRSRKTMAFCSPMLLTVITLGHSLQQLSPDGNHHTKGPFAAQSCCQSSHLGEGMVVMCTADCGRQHSSGIAADGLLQPAGHLHNAFHTVPASGSLRLSSHHEARAPPCQSAEDYIGTSAGGSNYSKHFPW